MVAALLHDVDDGKIFETADYENARRIMSDCRLTENTAAKEGNIRHNASINELICLSNMENINAVLIEDGLNQKERLIKLNKIAIHQMLILEEQTTKILK